MNTTRFVATAALAALAGCASAPERSESAGAPQLAIADPSSAVLELAPVAPVPGQSESPGALPPDAPDSAFAAIELAPVALVPAADTAADICQPEIIDARAALSPSCLNLIEDIHKRGNRINASSRVKRGLPSLCDSMWLPRCRHQY